MSKKKSSAKKPVVASKPDRKIEMQLRHAFTPAETIEIAKKMAEASRELNQAEDEKKAVTSQLKAKVDGISARVTEYAGKINSGFEYRNTQVLVKYHTPKTGQKRLTRLDTNEIVEIAEMSMGELQTELPLAEGSPHNPKKSDALPNPVLKEDDAKKVKASPGVVAAPADGDTNTAGEQE